MKSKTFTYFIGIDVSRNTLDFAVMQGKSFLFHKTINNVAPDIKQIITEFRSLPKFVLTRAVFCLEQTGIYSFHLIQSLRQLKCNIVIVTPHQLKVSSGVNRGKADKLDSIKIAAYAYKCRDDLRLLNPKRDIIKQLAQLSSLRYRLTAMHRGLKVRIQEQKAFDKTSFVKMSESLSKGSLKALEQDLKTIDETINDLSSKDENISRLLKIICSVKGVGAVTALQIIVTTNEFIDINNPKKFACYAGVAPFKSESGTVKYKARVSGMANKKNKSLTSLMRDQRVIRSW
jgi:transposase